MVMCGIAGIIVFEAGRFRVQAERMAAALRHRGPDAQGVLEYPNALLIHTRLAIVDLAGGAQPMASAREPGVAVTFNGEIYGYRPLRDRVTDYPFRTQSDTELLLALYHRDGSGMIENLPGMFAFGIWDDGSQKLTAGRDRFGEKPFYYAMFEDQGRRGIIFASEIKAILASGLVKPRLNRDALSHYLQYLYVHPGQTIYENVHTLPPAHTMIWRDGEAKVRRYWSPPPQREEIRLDSAVEEFRSLFKQAVARQFVADVPVGAFLSGGLDSSTVVAVGAKLKPGLQTFAFKFAAGGVDELVYADAVAKMHGTTHHVLDDTKADLAGLMREMADVYDEPFGDSSNIATYLISKLARQHMTVVLTGDGGDELLAGYSWYRALLQSSGDESPAEARLKQARYFSDETIAKFGLSPSRMPKRGGGGGGIDDVLRMDITDYMPGDILVKIDRASMAHALELRAPFLDIDLASFLISLPPRLKIDGTTDKLLLRRAFGDVWPQMVRDRSKQGFGAPVADWLARPELQELIRTRLKDPEHPLFALIPFEASRLAVDRQSFQCWSLLTLALWLERHPI